MRVVRDFLMHEYEINFFLLDAIPNRQLDHRTSCKSTLWAVKRVMRHIKTKDLPMASDIAARDLDFLHSHMAGLEQLVDELDLCYEDRTEALNSKYPVMTLIHALQSRPRLSHTNFLRSSNRG